MPDPLGLSAPLVQHHGPVARSPEALHEPEGAVAEQVLARVAGEEERGLVDEQELGPGASGELV